MIKKDSHGPPLRGLEETRAAFEKRALLPLLLLRFDQLVLDLLPAPQAIANIPARNPLAGFPFS